MSEQVDTVRPEFAAPDGLAAAALTLAVLWLGGLGSIAAVVLGYVSASLAHRRGEKASQVSFWAVVLGWAGIAVAAAIGIGLGIYFARHAPCDPASPGYADCVISRSGG